MKFMVSILLLLAIEVHAEPCVQSCGAEGGNPICIINTLEGRFCIPEVIPAPDHYEWRDTLGGYYETISNAVMIEPPDHTGTTVMQVSVRVCYPSGCTGWSVNSLRAIGVPIGYDPDWNRDGFVDSSDFPDFNRAFQGSWYMTR